jgi:hypothetical protein
VAVATSDPLPAATVQMRPELSVTEVSETDGLETMVWLTGGTGKLTVLVDPSAAVNLMLSVAAGRVEVTLSVSVIPVTVMVMSWPTTYEALSNVMVGAVQTSLTARSPLSFDKRSG